MGYIWNIYEKSFTPYFASLAPKHLVHRHKIEQKPNKLSKFWQSSTTKHAMRLFKKYICHNTKIYHFLVIACKL